MRLSLRAAMSLAAAVAFIVLVAVAVHWRERAAEERARAEAAQRQTRADAAGATASDRAARDVRVILQTGQQEIRHVQVIPGADTPIDPVRRAGVCDALGRVLDDAAVCADTAADAEPARAVPDAAP